MAYSDFLAHEIDRRIKLLIQRNGIAPSGSTPSGSSGGGPDGTTGGTPDGSPGDASSTSATDGFDYGQKPPVPTAYTSVDSRLDNMDEYVGVPYVSHDHDGIDSQRIAVKSIIIPAAVIGGTENITLEDYLLAGGIRFRHGTVTLDFSSRNLSPYDPRDTIAEGGRRFRLSFPYADFGVVLGVIPSLGNVVRSDAQAFAVESYAWRERGLSAMFTGSSVDSAGTAGRKIHADFLLSWRWVHYEDPNRAETLAPIGLTAPVSMMVYGT